MSIRGIVTTITVTLTILAIATAVTMIVTNSLGSRAIARVAQTMENAQELEQLEINLHRFHRERLLLALTKANEHAVAKDKAEAEISRWLQVVSQHVAKEPDRAVLASLRADVKALIARPVIVAKEEQLTIDTHRIKEMAPTYTALEQLLYDNLKLAEQAKVEALYWDRIANMIGFILMGVLPLAVAAVLFLLRRKLYRPFLNLRNLIVRYASDNSTRAPEAGPYELREIGHGFNEMANALARRREQQLAFLAAIAHDLRNPLTALKATAAVDMLNDKNISPERRRWHFNLIKRQVDRMNRMLGDFLDVSLIEANRLTLCLEPCDLVVLARSTVELFQDVSPKHRLEFSARADTVPILGDVTRLDQVLNNLVSNAIKYSPAGGTVRVTVEKTAVEALVAVSDEGFGISQNDLKQLFQPFRRLGTPQANIPGIGLGLSVTRRLVEAHKGIIEVDSILLKGSTFRVRLPLAGLEKNAAVSTFPLAARGRILAKAI